MESSVVIVSFSSKANGNCEQITDYIERKLIPRTNVRKYSFTQFDLNPCGKCSYQCFTNRTACPHIDDMEASILSEICSSNLTYFVVPNYCDYPCANFFIFNERSQCFFQKRPKRLEEYLRIEKRFIFVSNSESQNFNQAFTQHTSDDPKILYLLPKKYGMQSITGDLMTAGAAKKLDTFISKNNI